MPKLLRRMKKDTEPVNTIKIRKLQHLGHTMRNKSRYSILQAVFQGKIYGKSGRGRRRTSWLARSKGMVWKELIGVVSSRDRRREALLEWSPTLGVG